MVKKAVCFAYGIRLIAIWMLIPFVLMFVPTLYKEFSAKMTVAEAELKDEISRPYPVMYMRFSADIDGEEYFVEAPPESVTGDRITVILKNGEYYKTPVDSADLEANTTFGGRFLKVCKNNFGYHVVGLASALLITFLITFKSRKAIRTACPVISKVTDITGIVFSVVMSASLIFGVIDNTLDGLVIAYLALYAGILYTAVFGITWFVRSIIPEK